MIDVEAHIAFLGTQIVDGFRPEKIILFGSYAYGNPTYDSDIDLLVIMPFECHPHDQAVSIRRVLDSSMPLDVLVRTQEQVRERIELEDFFMREIVEKGKVLYETDCRGIVAPLQGAV